jgi:hypothetical protein
MSARGSTVSAVWRGNNRAAQNAWAGEHKAGVRHQAGYVPTCSHAWGTDQEGRAARCVAAQIAAIAAEGVPDVQ